jgi:hypothetical protein
MKASAFWLPTAIMVLALASVDTAWAQKRVRSTQAARQELDLLTAACTDSPEAHGHLYDTAHRCRIVFAIPDN